MQAHLRERRGNTFIKDGFFAATSNLDPEGKEVLDRLFENYQKNLHLKPFNALKDAVEKTGGEIVACLMDGEVVYSAATLGGKVKIHRGSMEGVILESSTRNTIAASGHPQKGDSMILSSGDSFIALEFLASPSFLTNFLKKLPERRIYIKEPLNDAVSVRSKRTTFTVAVVLLALLLVSIVFGVRQKRLSDARSKYQTILSQAQDEVDQAISLATIDSSRSRELFLGAEAKLVELLEFKVRDSKIDELKAKIEESRQGILGEYGSPPELFLNLTLLSSGFKGDEIKSSGGNIYVLDKTGKRIVSVEIESKKSKVVAGPGVIEEAFDLASYEDRAFVLGGDGVYEVSSTKNRVIDKSWGGDAFIQAFGGNMYVLDKSGNQVYRYQGQGSSFTTKQNWLSTSTGADFGSAISWGIDGAVYVLYPNAKISKYAQGNSQSFRVSGIIPEIGNIDAISADPDNQFLYLLDKAGKRIVVTDKKGVYKSQYISDQIGEAVGLIASEVSKKIILLTGEKLLSLEIKHL